MKKINISLAALERLLAESDPAVGRAAIQRVRWLHFAMKHEGDIGLTCRHFGIARSTFVRWAKRFDPQDPSSLEDGSRSPHHVRQPETDAAIIERIRDIRMNYPRLGKEPIRVMLKEQFGIDASASSIGRVIARHRLFFGASDSHRSKRRESDAPIPTPDTDIDTDSLLLLPGMTS